jgi:hypothetical protein
MNATYYAQRADPRSGLSLRPKASLANERFPPEALQRKTLYRSNRSLPTKGLGLGLG